MTFLRTNSSSTAARGTPAAQKEEKGSIAEDKLVIKEWDFYPLPPHAGGVQFEFQIHAPNGILRPSALANLAISREKTSTETYTLKIPFCRYFAVLEIMSAEAEDGAPIAEHIQNILAGAIQKSLTSLTSFKCYRTLPHIVPTEESSQGIHSRLKLRFRNALEATQFRELMYGVGIATYQQSPPENKDDSRSVYIKEGEEPSFVLVLSSIAPREPTRKSKRVIDKLRESTPKLETRMILNLVNFITDIECQFDKPILLGSGPEKKSDIQLRFGTSKNAKAFANFLKSRRISYCAKLNRIGSSVICVEQKDNMRFVESIHSALHPERISLPTNKANPSIYHYLEGRIKQPDYQGSSVINSVLNFLGLLSWFKFSKNQKIAAGLFCLFKGQSQAMTSHHASALAEENSALRRARTSSTVA